MHSLSQNNFQLSATGSSNHSSFIFIHMDGASILDLSGLNITSWNSNNSFNIFGTDTSETITGSAFVDKIYGGGGNDILMGGEGQDLLFGGAGGDILEGGLRNDVIYGQDGVDYAVFSGSINDYTIVDNLNGVISVIANNDYGTDYLIGVEFARIGGVDYALADASTTPFTSGEDTFTGQSFHEVLRSGDGNDTIDGSSGHDEIYGGEGNDTLIGGSGFDYLDGGNGNDILYAGNSNGYQNNYSEDSRATDRTGDVLFGGDGDDTLYASNEGGEFLNGWNGFDTAIFDAYYQNIEINMNEAGNLIVSGLARDSELQYVDYVRLTDHIFATAASGYTFDNNDDLYIATNDAETFYGLDGNDYIYGVGGNDIIYGGNGNDQLMGGEGDDYIYGGAGTNYLRGDAGNDWLFGNITDTYIGGDGYDTIVVEDFEGSGITNYSLEGLSIERVYATSGVDTLGASGSFNRVDFHGNGGADRLYGGYAGDYFFVTSETITDGVIRGDQGYDYVINETGAGGPRINVDMGTMQIEGYYGSSGDETIDASALAIYATIHTRGGSDIVTGSNYNDVIFVYDGNSTIDGGAGFDYIVFDNFDGSGLTFDLSASGIEGAIGRDGNDTFDASGSATFVTLYGYGGNDTLIGGAGVDAIYGGTGNDTLTGGASQDNFVFYENWGSDTVTDFTDALDVLIMSVAGLSSFNQLTISQDNADTLISYNGQSIRLTNFNAADLDALDFEFSPPAGSPEAPMSDDTDLSSLNDLSDSFKLGDDADMANELSSDAYIDSDYTDLSNIGELDYSDLLYDFA